MISLMLKKEILQLMIEYIFEIGGKDKTDKQIKGIERAFIASDGITHGFQNKIPLWLFGFLY